MPKNEIRAAGTFLRVVVCLALCCAGLLQSAWAQTERPADAKRIIVNLQRRGSRVLCPVTVEGTRLMLVLDTGAHGIVLQNSALNRLHLSVRGTANLHGINGVEKTSVYQAKSVEIGSFSGPLAFKGVPVYAMRDLDAGFDGLFGIDFFRGVPVTWDLQADQLRLADSPPSPTAQNELNQITSTSRLVVPFQTFPSFGIFVPVTIDAEKGWMLLDSGSDSSLFTLPVARALASAKGLDAPKIFDQKADGIGGAAVPSTLSQYDGIFSLGLDAMPNLPLGLSPLLATPSAEAIFTDLEQVNHSGLRFLGLLGMPFIDQFRAITFDYDNKTLTIEGITIRTRKTGVLSETESVIVERPAQFVVPNGGQLFTDDASAPTPLSPGELVHLAPRMRLEFFPSPGAAANPSPVSITVTPTATRPPERTTFVAR